MLFLDSLDSGRKPHLSSNIFFDNWDKPWNSLDFDGEELDARDLAEDELPSAYAYVGYPGENQGVEFEVADYIRDFHTDPDRLSPTLLDSRGYLTKDAMMKIQKFFTEQLQSERYCGVDDVVTQSVGVDDSRGDEPHYNVSLVVPYDIEGTVEEVHDRYVTPFFACFQNITDPGTFNEPYLFAYVT